MNSGYCITRIDQAVTIGTTLTRSWFRGHSQTWNKLTPRVFREDIHFAERNEKHKDLLAKLVPNRRMEQLSYSFSAVDGSAVLQRSFITSPIT